MSLKQNVCVADIVVMITFTENTAINYLEDGEIRPNERPVNRESPQVTATLTTSFLVLIGIFFPSVTGMLATPIR